MTSHRVLSWLALLPAAAAFGADEPLQEVLITAALRDTTAAEAPQSVSVLPSATLREAGVQHLGDVLALVPNLTAAGGTSRPRYFQLRGVGEQDQYQGAPNPSVGFMIDDIDFSGVGMPATLMDVEQVEVLRGPQGTAYGANALAGLINVRTRAPTPGFHAGGEATLGDFNTRAVGAYVGEGSGVGGWRAAAQRYRSDGFRRDAFLGRSDTNALDETTLRLKAFWQASEALRIDATLMHVNLDNGYDAWSIDNTRVTQSDRPGRDAQRSNGAAVKLTVDALPFGELRSITSVARSNIVFSFDGDWGNDAFWARQPACVPDPSLCVPYDYTSDTQRMRRTVAEDLRFIGDADHRLFGRATWLLGAYYLQLTEANDQQDNYNGASYIQLGSHYRARSGALYGQLDLPLGARAALSAGLRAEQRTADYDDSDGAHFDPTDHMLGGNLSWTWQVNDARRLYATLARGYKAGGFNIGMSIPQSRRLFRPEYLWNLETGIRHQAAGGALQWQADVFYMRRMDQQVGTSVQSDPSNPLTYEFYTDNAARGENYGVEAELAWQASRRWQLSGSLGLLGARYVDFRYNVTSYDSLGNPMVVLRDLSGRAQEYAPRYKWSLAAAYRHPSGWFVRADAGGSAGYYFSASHDQRSDPYTLINLRGGITRGMWTTNLWVRNLSDRRYALHGFYFGNEPPDFADKLYLQQGEPRQIGITISYEFEQ